MVAQQRRGAVATAGTARGRGNPQDAAGMPREGGRSVSSISPRGCGGRKRQPSAEKERRGCGKKSKKNRERDVGGRDTKGRPEEEEEGRQI